MATGEGHGGAWFLDQAQAGLSSLRYDPHAGATPATTLGVEDVLVEMHAASLNYRDLAICRGNPSSAIPLPTTPNVIPGSDGAGIILSVGSAVSNLKVGMRIITYIVPYIADNCLPTAEDVSTGLGQKTNGTLCRYGVFHHSALVPMPKHLTFEEAATLTCSGLTAWNALMGMAGKQVSRDDWILVQGTGGVSVAALQIAAAVGAKVVALTSSAAKAERLHSLGAKRVINYKTEQDWGKEVRKLTPGQRGVDHVLDVVGPKTLYESLTATRTHGLITVAGALGNSGALEKGSEEGPNVMSALIRLCTFRGIYLGSRSMLMDMAKFFEDKELKPALDSAVFTLENAKEAFERLEQQQHFSKIVIKIV